MDLCDRGELSALLGRHGFSFSKALGQNFLMARWVIDRMTRESSIDKSAGVLEIGPGAGCLTRELSAIAASVVSVELDQRLLPVLHETLSDCDNVTLLHADALELNLGQIAREHFKGLRGTVCANLPYSVTTPFLTKLLGSRSFESLTLMVQKEVAERLCARPGSAECGAITVFTQFYTQADILFTVPAACFWPRPKVDSAVIHLAARHERAVEEAQEKLFFRTVRSAFSQRRKTLVNALSAGFHELDKATITNVLLQAGLDPLVRGERLSIEDFARLSRVLGALM